MASRVLTLSPLKTEMASRVLMLSPLKTEMASGVLMLSPLKTEASRTRTEVLSAQCGYLYTPELHLQCGYALCFASVCIPSSNHSGMDLSSQSCCKALLPHSLSQGLRGVRSL